MQTVMYRVTGTSPLMMANPAETLAEPEEGVVKAGKRRDTPAEKAEKHAYRMPNGQLYMWPEAFRKAMIGGAKGRSIKMPGSSRSTSLPSILASRVFCVDIVVPLYYPDTDKPIEEYVIDSRRAVVPSTKGAIMAHRPVIEQWQAVVTFEYDDEGLDVAALTDMLTRGGQYVGVGAYRPEKSGPFGRFSVELYEPPARKRR